MTLNINPYVFLKLLKIQINVFTTLASSFCVSKRYSIFIFTSLSLEKCQVFKTSAVTETKFYPFRKVTRSQESEGMKLLCYFRYTNADCIILLLSACHVLVNRQDTEHYVWDRVDMKNADTKS